MDRRRALMANKGAPIGYEELKYLESSGTQYLRTALLSRGALEIEIAFDWSGRFVAGNTSAQVFGSRDAYGLRQYQLVLFDAAVSRAQFRYGTNSNTLDIFTGGYAEFSYRNGIAKLGDYYRNVTRDNFVSQYEFLFFNYSNGSSLTSADKFIGKMYYATLYFPDSTHIYKPMLRKLDSKPGFYDLNTKMFLVNSGTGEFGYEKLDGTYVAPV